MLLYSLSWGSLRVLYVLGGALVWCNPRFRALACKGGILLEGLGLSDLRLWVSGFRVWGLRLELPKFIAFLPDPPNTMAFVAMS